MNTSTNTRASVKAWPAPIVYKPSKVDIGQQAGTMKTYGRGINTCQTNFPERRCGAPSSGYKLNVSTLIAEQVVKC